MEAAEVQKIEAQYSAGFAPEEELPQFETLVDFLQWQQPEDGYKYEWNDGVTERSPKMITFENLYIVERLDDLFQSLKPSLPGRGKLFAEPQSMTSNRQLRIPDMAYYTAQQITEASQGIIPTIPEFIIEFISDNDPHPKVLAKMEEYFNAGARVVWLVVPQVKTVYAYSSPTEVVICKAERSCSAEPVLPGFKISAGELFA